MPIIEDAVKTSMAEFLRSKGYLSVDVKMGTRQGYDVEGRHPVNGKRLVVECKGQAQTGNQHARSWGNVASAILTSLNESYDSTNTNDVGIALPDTPEYKERMKLLRQFFKNENIAVFWVSELGTVEQW